MIDHQYGDIVFECDACGETLETDSSDFDEANILRRRAGWSAQKLQNEWLHFCSEACAR